VLQLIFSAASTWQGPGPCLVARVCRAWRSAAGGCKVTHLLYAAGYPTADDSFRTWMGRNSHRLSALILSSSSFQAANTLLGALADAASAAVAAGRPLPLHTLRVLGCQPDLEVSRRLLAGLCNLRCLQLSPAPPSTRRSGAHLRHGVVEGFAPLQQATQLQELYFSRPPEDKRCMQEVANLLPASLQRLSWTSSGFSPVVPDLSRLERLSFLRLQSWSKQAGWTAPLTRRLPRGLQQLDLGRVKIQPSGLEHERDVLTGFDGVCLRPTRDMELQRGWTNLRSLTGVYATSLTQLELCAVLRQLVKLSALESHAAHAQTNLPRVLPAACSCQGLRRLHLKLGSLQQQPGPLSVGSTRQCPPTTKHTHVMERYSQGWSALTYHRATRAPTPPLPHLLAQWRGWRGGPGPQVQLLSMGSWHFLPGTPCL
jgi:hypothetical protein